MKAINRDMLCMSICISIWDVCGPLWKLFNDKDSIISLLLINYVCMELWETLFD